MTRVDPAGCYFIYNFPIKQNKELLNNFILNISLGEYFGWVDQTFLSAIEYTWC